MRIEEGKYYRTRDGRKVGPAIKEDESEYSWNVSWQEGPYHYSNDGSSCLSDDRDDIVAEWTDEPQTLHISRIEYTGELGGATVFLSNGSELKGVEFVETAADGPSLPIARIYVRLLNN